MSYESNKFRGLARGVPKPLPSRSVWLWFVSNAGWVVLGLIAIGVLTAALAFGTAPTPRKPNRFGWAPRSADVGLPIRLATAVVPALMLLTAIAGFMVVHRRAHARRLLLYVHQAVRLNLPLPDLLAAAEAGERGRMRFRVRKLRRLLLAGLPLGSALELAAPGISRRNIAAIAAGEHLGRLPEALGRIVDRSLGAGESGTDDPAGAPSSVAASRLQLRWYPIVMLVFLGTTINLFMIFVMPKFFFLMKDFKQPMPKVTTWLVDVWGGWGGVVLSVVPLGLFVVYCGRTLARAVAPRWASAGSGYQLSDRILYWTPVVRRVILGRGLADAMYVTTDALSSGATLPRALAEGATIPDNAVVRQRLAKWATAVERGASAADAARAAGMPDLVCGMVTSGVNSAQLARVTQFLARYYDARASRIAAVLEGAAVPALSLVFGVAVGALALSVFLPLLGLVDATSRSNFK